MVIPLSDLMYPDTIEVVRLTRSVDAAGGEVVTEQAPVSMAASVQPYASSPVNAMRVIEHSSIIGRTMWTVYTRTDPNVAVDDLINFGDRVLVCTGPAASEPEAVAYGVDCVERA